MPVKATVRLYHDTEANRIKYEINTDGVGQTVEQTSYIFIKLNGL